MKVKVYDIDGNQTAEIELPDVFSTPYRPDVIKRAVLAQQSAKRQPYGTDPLAGLRSSAHYHGSRHYRYAMMNKEMSRMPRIHGKVGYMAWRARVAPQAVKGRRAHPPKAQKIWTQKINQNEKRLAIKSALAASTNTDLLKIRGHFHKSPIIFADDFDNLKTTKAIYGLLEKVAAAELTRTEKRKVRAGKGKMRGRKYSTKRGPLVLLSKNCPAIKASRNIPGVDAVSISNINVELLAPGTQAGRLIVTTKSTIDALQKKFGE
ncbi:MAG: 50S ribosomal protein L4 [Candidatus Aenigmarchaeota archaeon]|nr:50S ribosomal protein L4P [uncultured archaeon]MBS3050643.1 50S ribosomal protein L4 [Candidatus Aenigmarchaeota archaeon]